MLFSYLLSAALFGQSFVTAGRLYPRQISNLSGTSYSDSTSLSNPTLHRNSTSQSSPLSATTTWTASRGRNGGGGLGAGLVFPSNATGSAIGTTTSSSSTTTARSRGGNGGGGIGFPSGQSGGGIGTGTSPTTSIASSTTKSTTTASSRGGDGGGSDGGNSNGGGSNQGGPTNVGGSGRNTARPPPTLVMGTATFTGTAAAAFILSSGVPKGVEVVANGATLIGNAAGGYVASAYLTPEAQAQDSAMEITAGTNVIPYNTNAASQIIIGSQTLSPGAQVTVSGDVVSLAPGGGGVVVRVNDVPITTEAVGMALTVGTSLIPYTTNSAGDVVFGSQTLASGAQITLPAEVLSLEAGGKSMVVKENGVPITTEAVGSMGGFTGAVFAGDFTVGSNLFPFSTDAASDIIIGTQTLRPGAQATVWGGDVLSLAPGGSLVVYSRGVPVSTEGLGLSAATAKPTKKHSGAGSGSRNLRNWGFVITVGCLLVRICL